MIHLFAKTYGWTPRELEGFTMTELDYLSQLIEHDKADQ